MKKITKRSRLFTAVAMLAVSAVALSSATYAWFAMSSEVSVTGVQLTASTPSNIEIKKTSADDSTYSYVYRFLDSPTGFVLKPASSLKGLTSGIFYAKGVNIDGTVDTTTATDTFAPTTTELTKTEDGYFFDVDVTLRNTGGKEDAYLKLDMDRSEIKLDDSNMVNDDNTISLTKATRVAFLNADGTAEPITPADALVALPVNGNNLNVWRGSTETGTVNVAVDASSTTQAATYMNANSYIIKLSKAVLDSSAWKYDPKSMTIRIWIEGQDANAVKQVAGQMLVTNLVFTSTLIDPTVVTP